MERRSGFVARQHTESTHHAIDMYSAQKPFEGRKAGNCRVTGRGGFVDLPPGTSKGFCMVF